MFKFCFRKNNRIKKSLFIMTAIMLFGQVVQADKTSGEKKYKVRMEEVEEFFDDSVASKETVKEQKASSTTGQKRDTRRKRKRGSSHTVSLDSATIEISEEEQRHQAEVEMLEVLGSQVTSILQSPVLQQQKVHWELIWPIFNHDGLNLGAFMQAAYMHKNNHSMEGFIQLLKTIGGISYGVKNQKVPASVVFILSIFSQHAYYEKNLPLLKDPNKGFYKRLYNIMINHSLDISSYQEAMNNYAPYPEQEGTPELDTLSSFWTHNRKHFDRTLEPRNSTENLTIAFEYFIELEEKDSASSQLKFKGTFIDLIDAASHAWSSYEIKNGDIQFIRFLLNPDQVQESAPDCGEDENDDCIFIKPKSEEEEIKVLRMQPEYELRSELARLLELYGTDKQKQAAWVYWGINYLEVNLNDNTSSSYCYEGRCPDVTGTDSSSRLGEQEGVRNNIQTPSGTPAQEEKASGYFDSTLSTVSTMISGAGTLISGKKEHYIENNEDKRILEKFLGNIKYAFDTERFLSDLGVSLYVINTLINNTRGNYVSMYDIVKALHDLNIPLSKLITVLEQRYENRAAKWLKECLDNHDSVGQCKI